MTSQFGLILPHHGVTPTLGERVFVAHTATVIGDVEIGAESSVWFGATIRGDCNYVRIGARSNIQDGTVIHVSDPREGDEDGHPTIIGDSVTIGHNALLHGCVLEDWSFVGMAATVMDGAVVESHAMVAAGALVTPGKRVRSGELWAGTPAKCMRELTEDERRFFEASAGHYVEFAASYMTE